MGLEHAAGRQARDTRYEGAPADIGSPLRLIEVKSFGTSNRGYDLWLEVRQVEEAKANRGSRDSNLRTMGRGRRSAHAAPALLDDFELAIWS